MEGLISTGPTLSSFILFSLMSGFFFGIHKKVPKTCQASLLGSQKRRLINVRHLFFWIVQLFFWISRLFCGIKNPVILQKQ